MSNAKPTQNNATSSSKDAITKNNSDGKAIAKIFGIFIGVLLITVLVLTSLLPKPAHADDSVVTTPVVAEASSDVPAAPVEPVVADDKVCTVELPADSDWTDRVKDAFVKAGCSIGLFDHGDGNVTAEVTTPVEEVQVVAPAPTSTDSTTTTN